MSEKHRPTMHLRWLDDRLSGNAGARHLSALSPYPNSPISRVLQQLWTSDYEGVADEWRDLPMHWEPPND
jgi:hypothetical protein